MADRLFSDAELAQLYDVLHPADEREDFRFYHPLVMAARSVLDVGCGTGALLHRAREAGHTGRLCGLDPAAAMLEQARTRTDIEWVLGDLGTIAWDQQFDLIVMTGHAFQVLVEDDDVRTALAAIRSALTDDGRFAFETRNPLVREWEQWTDRDAMTATDASGATVQMEHEVETPTRAGIVRFAVKIASARWDRPQLSWSTLRFLDATSLSSFLADAGMTIEEQFGDWNREPLSGTSLEIITIARRS